MSSSESGDLQCCMTGVVAFLDVPGLLLRVRAYPRSLRCHARWLSLCLSLSPSSSPSPASSPSSSLAFFLSLSSFLPLSLSISHSASLSLSLHPYILHFYFSLSLSHSRARLRACKTDPRIYGGLINAGVYKGSSFVRKFNPLGPCRRPMPRVLGGS